MVELVDTLALGASAFGREGSSPFSRTSLEATVNAALSGRHLLYTVDKVLSKKRANLNVAPAYQQHYRDQGPIVAFQIHRLGCRYHCSQLCHAR